MTEFGVVEVRRLLPATPDEVFRWWTEPELMGQWLSPVGKATARVDLRVDGEFQVVMEGEEMTIDHHGRYLEIERPRRLVFTWVSPYTGGAGSIVSVRMEPEAGGTRLQLTHERLLPEIAESHRGGWGAMLDRLAGNLS